MEETVKNEWHGAPGVAVIGMAGRFPGARDIRQFWKNLVEGADNLTVFTDEELKDHVPADLLAGPGYVKAGYILDNVDEFDAAFFGYTPHEAETTDPQQRLFLECCWEAFEDAGHIPGENPSCGVFASISPSAYLPFDTSAFPGNPGGFFEVLLGNDKDYAASRVAYKMNLNGPAFSVQSACSSSLVGICQACQSLLDYHCDLALAGGASISLPERAGYMTSDEGGLSRDGRCHAFDHRASGMNYGNGVAVVLLKRVEDAVADGDHIYGVIRGFAVNNDGSDKVGFVAPSVRGQKLVIEEALDAAEVDPGSITCVETHGTGTPLGDPIELAALSQAYGEGLPCALTSVKTNIGHLNSAAGAAGLIRLMLSLDRGQITPLLNYEAPNPEIDFAKSRFYPSTETRPWTASPKRAGISSFGLGGTNAHLVVEEAPAVTGAAAACAWHLVPLSAKSPEALEARRLQLEQAVQDDPDMDMARLAWTLQRGRAPMPHRLCLVCRDREDLLDRLSRKLHERQAQAHAKAGIVRRVYFLFPGAGAQYPGMGRDLYNEEPAFRKAMDRCAGLFQPLLGQDIRTVLYQEDEAASAAALAGPEVGMAAMFATEYALARLWMHWGVAPAGCGGHSFGQYAAAVICGVFSLEDAVRLVHARSSLMEKALPGAMLMIFSSEESVRPLLSGTADVAAVNTDTLCTAAGTAEDIDALEERLSAERIRFRRLAVTRAGHSCLMDPVLDEFRAAVRTAELHAPALPLLDNVTGGWMTDADAVSADSWTAHIRRPVRFADNLACLLKDPGAVLLEVGPGKALTSFAKRHRALAESHAVAASLRAAGDAPAGDGLTMRQAYGQLFAAGLDPDWFAGEQGESHPIRLSLPPYPFDRKKFWFRKAGTGRPASGRGDAELMRSLMDKQKDSEKWYFQPVWQRGLLLSPLTDAELAALGGDWLVFADGAGVGEAVASRLQRAGLRVARVRPGAVFAHSGLTFVIRPDHEEDYAAMFNALRMEGHEPSSIVHAWSVTRDGDLGAGLEFCRAAMPLGYASLINLVRALVAAGLDQKPVRLGVVSNHLQSVTGGEILCPEKALVLGPARVIPSEFLHLQAMSIDIETPGADGVRPEVRDSLIRDVAAIPHSRPGESVSATFHATTAYRGRHRWAQTFDRVQMPKADPQAVPLREKGVYLVTGGFGGVAGELSMHLARTRHARLVLTGRTPMPPREEWDAWLAAHDEADGTSRRIAQVRALEEAGAEVLPVTADVADAAAMRRGWEEAVARFGRIDGIFHAASMASSSMIQAQTEDKARSVISPKVDGTLILEELAADRPDFLFLFSSISSHVGALGHTDYTAACLFMDTFTQARAREDRHTRIVAVNWGYWDGVGIGVLLLPKLVELMGDDIPVQGILPAEGMKCIERVLASPVEQVVISTSDYGMLVKTFLDSTKKALQDYESFSARTQRVQRPQLSVPYRAPATDVEKIVCQVWEELFGIEGIGCDDTFIELGGDSLHALPMIARLEEIFRVKVPIRSLLEENTPARLAVFLETLEKKKGQIRTIAAIFLKVRGMSPEEVRAMLAANKKA